MKMEKDVVLKDLDGRPVRDSESDLTLDRACTLALSRYGVGPDGRPADYSTQKKRYDIAKRIKAEENISAEDIAEIRICIAGTFAQPIIVGCIGEELDKIIIKQA